MTSSTNRSRGIRRRSTRPYKQYSNWWKLELAAWLTCGERLGQLELERRVEAALVLMVAEGVALQRLVPRVLLQPRQSTLDHPKRSRQR